MAWYESFATFFISLFRCRKAHNYTGEAARMEQQNPRSLPLQRINLTQETLVDQAPHSCLGYSSSSAFTLQRSSLERKSTSVPAPFPPLLSLPFELRTYIYELVLGGNFLNISVLRYRRRSHTSTHCSVTGRPPLSIQRSAEASDTGPTQSSITSLPLLLTCRSIYREAIYVLYTSNTFHFSDLSILIHWADLPLLRPQRLAEIRHLSVGWTYYSDPHHFRGTAAAPYDWKTWSRFWEIVATHLPGLRKLELRMEYVGRWHEIGLENDWVKAMLGVRRIKNAVVEIVFRNGPWTGVRCEEVERGLKEAWLQEGERHSED